jgi:SAM-dependent methyltransferase
MDLVERPGGAFRRHPWETVRAHHFASLAREFVPPSERRRILDVGAGDAWFALRLRELYGPGARLVCCDAGYSDGVLETIAAIREGRLEARRTLPEDERFDLALLLDVLEHVEEDGRTLSQIARLVDPGGHVIVSVPAWPCLFGRHDAALGHCRRYTPGRARRLCAAAGLELRRQGGLFASLLPARGVARLLEGLSRSSEPPPLELAWRRGEVLRRMVEAALAVDRAACAAGARAGLALPGLSWWGVCRRPR